MNTSQKAKKQEILNTLSKIEEQSKSLYSALEKVYENGSIEDEKNFVSFCYSLQKLTKQAVDQTGYFKSLCGIGRNSYAPEELEGDVTPLTDLVSVEMEKIKNEIDDGNSARPIKASDITKEQWLEYSEARKVFYKENYEDWQKYYDEKKQEGKDCLFHPVSIETNIVLDEEIIAAAKGFMTGPVGLFRNKMVVAETQRFDDIHEMRIFLINVQCKTKDMVLYETHERSGKYYWRGAFVDKL
jgi:regulator of replication initiation timing